MGGAGGEGGVNSIRSAKRPSDQFSPVTSTNVVIIP